jgi:hypothetical protein
MIRLFFFCVVESEKTSYYSLSAGTLAVAVAGSARALWMAVVVKLDKASTVKLVWCACEWNNETMEGSAQTRELN